MMNYHKIKNYIVGHRVISAVVLIVIIFAGYQGYKSITSTSGETRYVLAAVEKGTIISSVTGSGQVSASNQVDVKPKTSGDVVYVGVTAGQEVKAGALIAQLDTRDALKAIRDAEVNLETAKINMEKLVGSSDLSVPKNQSDAQEDLDKSYEDGFNAVSNAFLDLPSIMSGLQGILFEKNISSEWNIDYFSSSVKTYDESIQQFRDDTFAKYQDARQRYDKNFLNYKLTNRSSDTAVIDSLISETYNTTKAIAEAIKSANNLIQFYEDILTKKSLKANSLADTFLSTLSGYTGKANSHLSSLLSAQKSIKNYKTTLSEVGLDARTEQIIVDQKENALITAKEDLVDCYVRAPFAGTIAKLVVKKGDSASSGTSMATLITKQKVAEISLNEVDIAKVKVGQKANLTFDAVDGLNVVGTVIEVDGLGTVSQGVVTYTVKIGFDTQDERVKSGMSVNVSIITDVKQDILVVANSAVKTQGESKYVEMFNQPIDQVQGTQGFVSAIAPIKQQVEVGISNDTLTEIVSGLKEGDQIVSKTITSTTKTAATTAKTGNLFGGGMGGPR
ncbi:MAG: efflux RND transporter periplasmic adaptor subunit [Candidatus Pacebacteria bacterium]|nr:efflux RND transporter periplasmic adaptor subunit [Candidatus Paceibacterota bacterium]